VTSSTGVQKAVEVLRGAEQAAVAAELHGHVMRCVLDQNGNHVIQKCIEQARVRARGSVVSRGAM
jgi:hypothetical protein